MRLFLAFVTAFVSISAGLSAKKPRARARIKKKELVNQRLLRIRGAICFLAYRSRSDTLFTASSDAMETSSFSVTEVVIVVGVETVLGPGTIAWRARLLRG